MEDVFITTSKIEVKHDPNLDMYSVVIKLPKPKGPLVFGVSKEQLQDLLKKLKKVLGE